jgi:hypothetical protein
MVGEATWLGLELEGHLNTLLSQNSLQGTCTLACCVSIRMRELRMITHYCQIVGYVYTFRLSHCYCNGKPACKLFIVKMLLC